MHIDHKRNVHQVMEDLKKMFRKKGFHLSWTIVFGGGDDKKIVSKNRRKAVKKKT